MGKQGWDLGNAQYVPDLAAVEFPRPPTRFVHPDPVVLVDTSPRTAQRSFPRAFAEINSAPLPRRALDFVEPRGLPCDK